MVSLIQSAMNDNMTNETEIDNSAVRNKAMGRHLQAMRSAVQILSDMPYRDYIESIYLYGSCARGTQKYNSDVDLLIECNALFTPKIGRKMRLAVMPEEKDIPEVELKFTRTTNWKEDKDPFSRNLRKDGILLWKKQ